jgi:flagellar hook-basal body complex protein FliE
VKIGGYGAAAYAQAAQRLREAAPGAGVAGTAAGVETAGSSFGAMLGSEVSGAVQGLRNGEKQSIDGLLGRTGLQGVVEAVSAAEIGLQKVTAVRDRVIAAYQEIMRMPI